MLVPGCCAGALGDHSTEAGAKRRSPAARASVQLSIFHPFEAFFSSLSLDSGVLTYQKTFDFKSSKLFSFLYN